MIRFNANTSERSMKMMEQREGGRPHERATHALAQRTFWELVLADRNPSCCVLCNGSGAQF